MTDNADVEGVETVSDDAENTSETQSAPEFVVPAEYSEKGWAKNIKSEADLWKSMDNAQSLIGKKTIGIPDFEKANDEELNSYYSHTRPKEAGEYDLDKRYNDEERKALQEVFYKNGLTKSQAKNVMEQVQSHIDAEFNEEYGKESLENSFKSQFGDNWEKDIVPIKDALKACLSEEQLHSISEDLPNKAIIALFGVTKSIMDKYGAIETDANLGRDRSVKPTMDFAEFYKKMQEADRMPNNAEVKEKLKKLYYGE